MSDVSLLSFGRQLVRSLALPELAGGYADLVRQWRRNDSLARLVKEKGLEAALSGDAMKGLRKGGGELVTAAEQEAERLMTRAVRERYPGHAVIGEEHGATGSGATRWVFDPVDGTSAMIRTAMAEAFGLALPQPAPAFGVTVAVVEGEEAVLGIVAELRPRDGALVIANTWAGVKGEGAILFASEELGVSTPTPPASRRASRGDTQAFKRLGYTRNGQPVILPPAPATLADAALVSTAPPVMFNTPEKWSGFQALQEATGKPCVTGQNCVGFMRLLERDGGIGVAYEADLAYHDVAVLAPILQGAGITVTDGRGTPLRFPESAIGQEFSVLAAQPQLHARALECVLAGVAPARNSFAARDGLHQGYVQKFSALLI